MNRTGKIKTFFFISLDGYVSKMSGDMDWLLDYPRPCGVDYGLGAFARTVGCAVLNGIYHARLQACDLCPPAGLKSQVLIPDGPALMPEVKPGFILLKPGFGYVEAVDAIRRETAGDIWLAGDHDMLSVFMERGLIDEVTLNVVPVTLGNGYAPFSRNRAERRWSLEHCDRFDNGVVQMRYVAER